MNDLSIPGPVRARVHPAAISRVTRFFDGSIDDILAELLQNARRAGSRRIDILTAPVVPGAAQTLVSVIDDGCGIADPALLLEFGETGWDERIRAEDPAGMGLYSLARRGCAVSSRQPNGPGWSLRLHPEHFLGEIDATPIPDPDAPRPHGTGVVFVADQPPEAVRGAIEAAARYHPLPVFLDTQRLSRRCFLEGAVHVENWRGMRFGVRADAWNDYPRDDLNFHGLVLRAGLPSVPTLDDRFWTVAADIEACPELELVLPADLAFAGRSRDHVDDARPLVAADSDIDPATLADLLRDAFFAPSDEASADSWETRQDSFEEDARRLALSLLLSENDARRDSIVHAVRRHVLWLAPRDAQMHIDIRAGRVEVRLDPAPEPTPTAAWAPPGRRPRAGRGEPRRGPAPPRQRAGSGCGRGMGG